MTNPIIALPPMTDADWRRFDKNLRRDEATGCLEWMGYRSRSGYGQFHIGGRQGVLIAAHRVAFLRTEVLSLEMPDVLHRCDNRACCELGHLFAGNDALNAFDRAKKDRSRRSRRGFPRGVQPVNESPYFQGNAWVNGRMIYLGTFPTVEEAAKAVQEARKRHISPYATSL